MRSPKNFFQSSSVIYECNGTDLGAFCGRFTRFLALRGCVYIPKIEISNCLSLREVNNCHYLYNAGSGRPAFASSLLTAGTFLALQSLLCC